jgi:transposase
MVEYVGFDVSKEETAFCVKGKDGEILVWGKVGTDATTLFDALKAHCLCPKRIVMETGTMSAEVDRSFKAENQTDANIPPIFWAPFTNFDDGGGERAVTN